MSWLCGVVSGVLRKIAGAFRFPGGSSMVEVRIGDLAAGKMTRKKVTLRRIEAGDDGVYGVLTTPSGLQVYTLECPWRGNREGVSCIPAGNYVVEWTTKPAHGECYEVKEVPGRTAILFHAANWAGDVSRGYVTELHGCIAPGRSIQDAMVLRGALKTPTRATQKGVTSSRDALGALVDDLEKENFVLVIEWGPQVPREVYGA